jgi:hypothetical protein
MQKRAGETPELFFISEDARHRCAEHGVAITSDAFDRRQDDCADLIRKPRLVRRRNGSFGFEAWKSKFRWFIRHLVFVAELVLTHWLTHVSWPLKEPPWRA